MNTKYCQCCAMLMEEGNELYGTNSVESINEDYCKYCFEKGKFIFKDTMKEMIEICVPHVVKSNKYMKEDSARKITMEFFPNLKDGRSKLLCQDQEQKMI